MKKKYFYIIASILFPLLILVGVGTWLIYSETIFRPIYDENNPLAVYFEDNQSSVYTSNGILPQFQSEVQNVDGSLLSYSYADKNFFDAYTNASFSPGEPVDVGTYWVRITPPGEGNKPLYVTFSITKATPTISNEVNVIYNQGERNSYFTTDQITSEISYNGSFVNINVPVNGKIQFSDKTNSTLKVGTFDYEWTFIPNSTKNYETVTGKCSITTFASVDFYDGNNKVHTEEVASGSKVNSYQYSKVAYDFNEWKKDGQSFDFSNSITSNIRLDASLTPITYTISYNLNDGICSSTLVTSYTIETPAFTLPSPTPNDSRRKFAGWEGTDLNEITKPVTIEKQWGNREYNAVYSKFFKIVVSDSTVLYERKQQEFNITYYVEDEKVDKVPEKITINKNYSGGNREDVGTYTLNIAYPTINTDLYSFDSSSSTLSGNLTINPRTINLQNALVKFDYDYDASVNDASVMTYSSIRDNKIIPNIKLIDNDTNISYNISPTGKSVYDLNNFTISMTDGNVTYTTENQNENVAGSTYLATLKLDSTNYKLEANEVLVKYQTAKIGSNYYTIEDAIKKATEDAKKNATSNSTIVTAGNETKGIYVETNFTALDPYPYESKSYNLEKVKLFVPYTTSTSEKKEVTNTNENDVYSVLNIHEGITLNFKDKSSLIVASKIGAKGGGQTSNSLIRGVLVNNGIMKFESGCKLKSYGFLKGIGMIYLESGAEAEDVMTSYDWPGGTAATALSKDCFPTNSYTFHNISCPMTIYSGATLNAYIMTNILSKAKFKSILLIGKKGSETCLFKPVDDKGYILKSTENPGELSKIETSNQKIDIKDYIGISGNYTDNTINESFEGLNIKTGLDNPIPIGLMNIEILSNSNLEIKSSDYLFLPGSSLIINENSTFNVTNSEVDFSFVKKADYNNYMNGGDRNFLRSSYSKDQNDAYLLCNGNFSCKGNFGGTIKTNKLGAKVSLEGKVTSNYISLRNTTAPYTATGISKTYIRLCKNNVLDNNETELFTSGSFNSYKKDDNNYGFYNNSLTISYDANGGVGNYENKNITLKDSSYTISENDFPSNDPSRNYFTFGGWYVDKECKTPAKGYTIYTGIKLYAKWNPISYGLEYVDVYEKNFDSGNKSKNDNIKEFNYFTNESLQNPINGDYIFSGWYLDEACENKISLINGENLVNYVKDNKVTLYALWYQDGATKYTIYYENDNNNVTCSDYEQFVVTEDASFDWNKIKLPELSNKDNDYEVNLYFGGWYLDDREINNINSDLFVFNSESNVYEITLKAKWIEKNILNIMYENVIFKKIYYKPNYSFKVPSLSDKGISLDERKVFIAWEFNDETKINEGETVTLTNQTTLTAIISSYYKLRIDTNKYTTVTVTLILNQGYRVEYKDNIAKAYPFDGTTYQNGDEVFVTTGSEFSARYSAQSNSKDNSATITGADKNTSLTTSDQNYKVVDSDITITPKGVENCIISGTMITLADGTKKKVEDLNLDDVLLVFNHEEGRLDTARIIFIENDGYDYYDVIRLYFSDDTEIGVIYEHGFFDLTTNRYEYITEDNYLEFIGHQFYKIDDDGNRKEVTLVNAKISTEYTCSYEFPTFFHLNYFNNDLLSMPGGIAGIFNIFEYDNNLKYDEEKMNNDINQYGLLGYDYFENLVSYEDYCSYPAKYFAVAMGKGILTEERLMYLINRYVYKKENE